MKNQNEEMKFLLSALKRFPQKGADGKLQAWDSADELILKHVGLPSNQRILVVNDRFGALSCSLQELDITAYTDSYLSYRSIQINSGNRIMPLTQLGKIEGTFDLVLVRIPKNMSFFEDILCQLTRHLRVGSKVICGYMIKHQAKASFDLLNKYIGATTTSLAQKKARLIFAEFGKERFEKGPAVSPYPLKLKVEPFEKPFLNNSNLFSREKLDIGTRFLLDHIPQGRYSAILDLGCANGIVGIAAKKLNPSAKIIFSDESQMAIESAETNYRSYFSDAAEFYWTHCYENQKPESVDLVICNPPFHQGNAVGDFIAWQMFKDAHRALVNGGMLRVIGNSHLHYPSVLKKIFGGSRVVAKNQKFTIVDAIKK